MLTFHDPIFNEEAKKHGEEFDALKLEAETQKNLTRNFEKEFEKHAKTENSEKKDLGDVLRKKYQVSKESYDKNQLK